MKVKLITLFCSLLLLTGAGVGAVLYYRFPLYYPQGYPLILVFFLLTEPAVVYAVVPKTGKPETAGTSMKVYLVTRVAKLLSAVVFLGIYALAVSVEIKKFAAVFLAFYLFSGLLETCFLTRFERQAAHTKKKHDTP